MSISAGPVISTPSEERTRQERAGRKGPLLDTHHVPELRSLVCSCRQKCRPSKSCISLVNSEASSLTKNDSLEQPVAQNGGAAAVRAALANGRLSSFEGV